MKKIGTWLVTTGPLLLLTGLQSAHAGGRDDFWCYFLPWLCSGGGKGGPTSVPEPEMAALLGIGVVATGVSAYRRWKNRR